METPHRQCTGTWLKTWRDGEEAGPHLFQLLSWYSVQGRVSGVVPAPRSLVCAGKTEPSVASEPRGSCSASASSCPRLALGPTAQQNVVGGAARLASPRRKPSC